MLPISRSVDARRFIPCGIVGVKSCRWMSFLFLAPVILAVLFAGSAVPAAAAIPRAVWVWETDTFRWLDREAQWDETFAFLARRNLATVYLYADRYKGRNIIRDEPDKYRRLIAALHGRG